MAIATGIAKQLKYKAETTWGSAPTATGAQLLRRVTGTPNLKKATYESNELASHRQRIDFRHGVRSVDFAYAGELSAGTFEDFFAAAVRRAFTAVSAIATLSLTFAGSGPTYTITRAAGSWLTDGIKKGQLGRVTAGAVNAANLNKNLLVLSLTSTVLTVMPLNGVALVAEGPIASCTWTPTGKVSFAPSTGHTDPSFAFEDWHADLSPTVSELYLGCKLNQMDIALPATGIATVGMSFMGKDLTTSASEYFTSPTAETSTGVLAAVNGLLVAQGGAVATVTGFNFSVKGNMTAEPVVGANTYPAIAAGRVLVDGQLTAQFDSATMRDYFINETEVSLMVALAASTSAIADFVSFCVPRIKFGAADKDDGDKLILRTMPFTALYNSAGGAGQDQEQTTLYIQDSQA